MLSKEKIDAFWQARTEIADPRLATNYRDDGRLAIDLHFVTQHIPQDSQILDLGAGTCTLAGCLVSHAKQVVAVEKFPEFLAAASSAPNLKKICCDVNNFKSVDTFDGIILFGVANFLTLAEEEQLYIKCKQMLAINGVFIVKHQCGIKDTVIVDHYSEELNAHYNARYPAVDDTRKCLAENFDVKVVDIYPPTLNRWPDTHFYGFVCRNKR